MLVKGAPDDEFQITDGISRQFDISTFLVMYQSQHKLFIQSEALALQISIVNSHWETLMKF